MKPAIAFIGVGHIGGSMAAGLRAADAVAQIHGCDSNPEALAQARELGLIDVAHPSPEDAVRDAELIVLATPPAALAEACRAVAPLLRAGQTVTDVGSVKQPVLRDIAGDGEVPAWFVPGHPISGTEKSGAQHARGDLFRDRRVVLTPLPHTDPEKLERVRWLWTQLGAQVEQMEAQAHDALFAGISHLPHVLAYALMEVLSRSFQGGELKRYAAGGLLDFTRIASSNPDLWVDICQANRTHLIPLLEQTRGRLDDLVAALEEDRSEVLREVFATAKQSRDTLRPDDSDRHE